MAKGNPSKLLVKRNHPLENLNICITVIINSERFL